MSQNMLDIDPGYMIQSDGMSTNSKNDKPVHGVGEVIALFSLIPAQTIALAVALHEKTARESSLYVNIYQWATAIVVILLLSIVFTPRVIFLCNIFKTLKFWKMLKVLDTLEEHGVIKAIKQTKKIRFYYNQGTRIIALLCVCLTCVFAYFTVKAARSGDFPGQHLACYFQVEEEIPLTPTDDGRQVHALIVPLLEHYEGQIPKRSITIGIIMDNDLAKSWEPIGCDAYRGESDQEPTILYSLPNPVEDGNVVGLITDGWTLEIHSNYDQPHFLKFKFQQKPNSPIINNIQDKIQILETSLR